MDGLTRRSSQRNLHLRSKPLIKVSILCNLTFLCGNIDMGDSNLKRKKNHIVSDNNCSIKNVLCQKPDKMSVPSSNREVNKGMCSSYVRNQFVHFYKSFLHSFTVPELHANLHVSTNEWLLRYRVRAIILMNLLIHVFLYPPPSSHNIKAFKVRAMIRSKYV
jgi:hypothetical protein